MILRELSMETLRSPLKVRFQHASFDRSNTESVIVRAANESGQEELGEGCPRVYVTGESLESAKAFFQEFRDEWLTISNLPDLRHWINTNRNSIDSNPAAFCAVESALLRLLAREADVSLESILELPELSGVFKYSAIIGSRDSAQFRDQFQQYLEFGFTDFKIKIFGDTGTDYANRKNLLDNGTPDLTVRADANSIWSSAGAAIEYFKNLDYPFVAIEEPLKKGQFSDCKIIAESLGIPVILDESFTRVADFNDISADPASWIANLRISKMGGILRSLEIAEMAKQNGVSIILGAQVGESSILTRMALVVANMYRNSVIAQEGAFGSRLLTRDLVDPPIEFGAGGILKAEDIYDLIRPVG